MENCTAIELFIGMIMSQNSCTQEDACDGEGGTFHPQREAPVRGPTMSLNNADENDGVGLCSL